MKKYLNLISLISLIFFGSLFPMTSPSLAPQRQGIKKIIPSQANLTFENAQQSPTLKNIIKTLRSAGIGNDQILVTLKTLIESELVIRLLEGLRIKINDNQMATMIKRANLNTEELKELSKTGKWLKLDFDKYIKIAQGHQRLPIKTLTTETPKSSLEQVASQEKEPKKEARELLKKMETLSPEELLGVADNASFKEVLLAKEKLLNIWDPNKNLEIKEEANEIYNLINRASYRWLAEHPDRNKFALQIYSDVEPM